MARFCGQARETTKAGVAPSLAKQGRAGEGCFCVWLLFLGYEAEPGVLRKEVREEHPSPTLPFAARKGGGKTCASQMTEQAVLVFASATNDKPAFRQVGPKALDDQLRCYKALPAFAGMTHWQSRAGARDCFGDSGGNKKPTLRVGSS